MKQFLLPAGVPVLVTTLLTSPALAQFPPAGGYQVSGTLNVIEHDVGFGSIGRTVFGPVAGAKIPGAVTMLDGDVHGIFDPTAHNSLFLIVEDANDFDLAGPATSDGPAGVVVALSSGLWLYELDPDPLTPDFVVTLIEDGAGFQDLDMVRAANLDGQGRNDLMVVDGTTVRVLLDSGSGWSSSGSFDVGSVPRDLVAIDWDSSASTDRHIAVHLDQSVQVWEPSASSPPYVLDEGFLGYGVGGHLAAIQATTADPNVKLAYVTPVTGVGDYLLLLTPGGGRTNCGVLTTTVGNTRSLASSVYVSGSASRVDLMATQLGVPNADLFLMRNANPPYDLPTPQVEWDLPGSIHAADGRPAFGDVTMDRVPEGLVGSTMLDEFYCFLGQPLQVDPTSPLTGTFNSAAITSSPHFFVLNINNPTSVAPPYDFTHWQLLLWRSDNGTVLNRQALANNVFPLGKDAQQNPLADQDIGAALDLGSGNPCAFDGAFFISVRLIKLDGDSIVLSSSFTHGGLATSETVKATINPEELEEMAVTGCSGQLPGGPGFVPLPDIPAIAEQASPQIPAMVVGPSGPWE